MCLTCTKPPIDVVDLYQAQLLDRIEDPYQVENEQKFRIHSVKHWKIRGTNVTLAVLGYQTLPENYIVATFGEASDIRQFEGYDDSVQYYCENYAGNVPYQPAVKEICLVKMSSGHWYRSVYIQTLANNRAFVYCFDYGVFCTVMLADIRVRIQ